MSAPLDRLAERVAVWNREMVDFETMRLLANVADELIAVARAAEKFDECRRASYWPEGSFTGPEVDAQAVAVAELFHALAALHAKLAESVKA